MFGLNAECAFWLVKEAFRVECGCGGGCSVVMLCSVAECERGEGYCWLSVSGGEFALVGECWGDYVHF